MFRSITVVTTVLALGNAPQVSDPSEYEVKAAFLFNFAKFVEWPADSFKEASSPIVVGILGKDPFGKTLDKALKGQRANGRGFELVRGKTLDEVRPCHILFVADSERENLDEIRRALRASPVLTLGESEGFAGSGGIIGFLRDDKTIRFELNAQAGKDAGLKFSSKLLKLAKNIKEGRGGP